MYPAIVSTSHVRVYDFPYEDLQIGMIVDRFADWCPNTFLGHRIVARYSNGTFQTKGDNNKYPDPDFLTKQNYIGRAEVTMQPVDITCIVSGQ